MTTEHRTETPLVPMDDAAPAPAATVAPPRPWELAGPEQAAGDPGGRQTAYALAAMLIDAVRDEQALTRRPLRGIVIGCGNGWIAHRLLEAGLASVVAVDWRRDEIAAALELRDRLAFAPSELQLRPVASVAELAATTPRPARFDIAFISRDVGERDAVIPFAHSAGARLCAIESADRLADRDRAREAGFGRISLSEPPADAGRQLILRQRALVLARPGGNLAAEARHHE